VVLDGHWRYHLSRPFPSSSALEGRDRAWEKRGGPKPGTRCDNYINDTSRLAGGPPCVRENALFVAIDMAARDEIAV
jgi:hypothetical protein